jgi:protein TonB
MSLNLTIRFCLFLCFTNFYSNAQTVDTIWFNSKWEKSTKAESVYHRVIQKSSDLKSYLVSDYYNTGEIQMRGTYSSLEPEVKDGQFTWWFKNGQKRAETLYKDRNAIKEIKWDEAGKVTFRRELVDITHTEDGKKVETKAYLDVAPEFEGGMSAVNKFIDKNFRYPAQLQENPPHGKIIVGLAIDTNGKVINVNIQQGLDPLLDAEAMRVVKKLPDWKPGILDGKPVAIRISIPINL